MNNGLPVALSPAGIEEWYSLTVLLSLGGWVSFLSGTGLSEVTGSLGVTGTSGTGSPGVTGTSGTGTGLSITVVILLAFLFGVLSLETETTLVKVPALLVLKTTKKLKYSLHIMECLESRINHCF